MHINIIVCLSIHIIKIEYLLKNKCLHNKQLPQKIYFRYFSSNSFSKLNLQNNMIVQINLHPCKDLFNTNNNKIYHILSQLVNEFFYKMVFNFGKRKFNISDKEGIFFIRIKTDVFYFILITYLK